MKTNKMNKLSEILRDISIQVAESAILAEMKVVRMPSGAYHFWDVNHAIPHNVTKAEILLDGAWELIHFNRVWGKALDPSGEGTWLKQKSAVGFHPTLGTRTYPVRYCI